MAGGPPFLHSTYFPFAGFTPLCAMISLPALTVWYSGCIAIFVSGFALASGAVSEVGAPSSRFSRVGLSAIFSAPIFSISAYLAD
jgi:hypothetical protein